MSTEATVAESAYPVWVEADYPERLSRVGIFFKWWLFVIPHGFVLYFYTLLVEYSAVLFIPLTGLWVLITGRYPRWLWGWYVHYIRWYLRVAAYQYLLTDAYPPFNGNPDSPYDVRFDIEYPDRMNRLLWLVKWILAIPHYIVLIFLSLAFFVVWIIAWWAILFTGRYPRGLFDFSIGFLRWVARVMAYTFWLRDEYPPFSLKEAGAKPGIVQDLLSLKARVSELPRQYPVGGLSVGPGVGQAQEQITIICRNIDEAIRALNIGLDPHDRPITKPQIADGLNRLVNATRNPAFAGLMTVMLSGEGIQVLENYVNELEQIANRIS